MLEAIINNDKRPEKRPCRSDTLYCPFFQLKEQLFVQGPYVAGGGIYVDIFNAIDGTIMLYINVDNRGLDGTVILTCPNESAMSEMPKYLYNVLFKVLYMATKNGDRSLNDIKGKNIKICIKKETLIEMPPYAKSLSKLGTW